MVLPIGRPYNAFFGLAHLFVNQEDQRPEGVFGIVNCFCSSVLSVIQDAPECTFKFNSKSNF